MSAQAAVGVLFEALIAAGKLVTKVPQVSIQKHTQSILGCRRRHLAR
jgi:hypothetical protein